MSIPTSGCLGQVHGLWTFPGLCLILHPCIISSNVHSITSENSLYLATHPCLCPCVEMSSTTATALKDSPSAGQHRFLKTPKSRSPGSLWPNLEDLKEHFDSLGWGKTLSVLLLWCGRAQAKLNHSHLPEVWFVRQRWSWGKWART